MPRWCKKCCQNETLPASFITPDASGKRAQSTPLPKDKKLFSTKPDSPRGDIQQPSWQTRQRRTFGFFTFFLWENALTRTVFEGLKVGTCKGNAKESFLMCLTSWTNAQFRTNNSRLDVATPHGRQRYQQCNSSWGPVNADFRLVNLHCNGARPYLHHTSENTTNTFEVCCAEYFALSLSSSFVQTFLPWFSCCWM